MPKPFEAAQKQVMTALGLLDQESADSIIGEPAPEEYKALVAGVNGAFQMLWILAASNGLKQKPEVKKMGGQAQLILLTLIHYAFALGVRYGRGGK